MRLRRFRLVPAGKRQETTAGSIPGRPHTRTRTNIIITLLPMKKLNLLMLLLVAAVCLPAFRATAQQMPELPMDQAIRYGKLPNGLTYYIRHNKLPDW